MAQESGRVLSIARAAVRAGWLAGADDVPRELRVALVALGDADAELVQAMLRAARGTRYACLRFAEPSETTRLLVTGALDAVLVDLDRLRWSGATGDGLAVTSRVPVVALVEDWRPGEEGMAVAAGMVDILEKEELDAERLDRAIRLAVARARASSAAFAVGRPRGDDPWAELRPLVGRAIAAHARRGRSFALVRIDLVAVDEDDPSDVGGLFQRVRSILAQRLRARLRRSDAVLEPRPGRLAALVEDLPAARDAVTVACKLEPVLATPLTIGDRELRPQLRTGWAVYPIDGTDPEALLGGLESGLAGAERDPGSCQGFADPDLAAVYRRVLRLGPAFAAALAAGDIELALQPQTTLRPGPVGLTAVPRWQPAGEPLLERGDLREIAELVGTLDELTRCVLGLAARLLAKWHGEGLDQARLAVPVLTRRQLARSDLPAIIREVTGGAGIPPETLELELPAGAVASGSRADREVVAELARTGVRLALRLGTDGPSPGMLVDLPLHTLKLAPELLGEAGHDHRRTTFLRGLVELARALSLRVVAEDVETPGQLQLAREIGCDAVQALIVAPPLPEPEARRWLLRAHRRLAR